MARANFELRPRWLLLQYALGARTKSNGSPATVTARDASRLLEEMASEENLALALLNVVRNKGAPAIDGLESATRTAQMRRPDLDCGNT
jgi:hypothetical protein